MTGALVLSLQTASPLENGIHAPSWFNWTCLFALVAALSVNLRKGATDERWVSGACLICTGYLLIKTEPWNAASDAELASTLSRFLSSTWHGVATAALLCGWSLVGVGFVAGRAVHALHTDSTTLPPRVFAWLVGLTITLFGLRGLIGYASGNTSLFFH